MSSADRSKIALLAALKECALLMELRGDNPFRCRAFENGARTLEEVEGEPAEWLASGALEGIKGIGKGLLGHIAEFAASGTIAELDEVRAAVPKGLVDISRIPGLGGKKIQTLWKELGIDSLETLEAACNDGRVVALKGFGDKTAVKILAGIEQRKKFSERHLASTGREAAEALLARLRTLKSVRRIEVAGSLRRRRETIKDLDIVVDSDDAPAVMEAFITAPGVERVVNHGPTKSSVLMLSGVPADLRVVKGDEFAAALNYFTGSKEHNTHLRGRAKKMGLRLNEYGLFREVNGEKGEALPCATEADIYNHLGLAYVEPELREDRGEIDAAEQGANPGLPKLITREDLVGLLHCHSTYSDGKATLEQMADAAKQRGFAYFGICDHSKSAAYAGGLREHDVQRQHMEIDHLNKRAGSIPILKGIESDILADGRLDYDDDVLATFDFVVISVHSLFNLSREEMTARVCRAISHPAARILGHPTGRLLLRREGYQLDMEKVFEAAAKHDVAIEINAHPMRLDLDWTLIRQAKKAGCIFSINPDAHSVADIDLIDYGVGIARKGWLTKDDVINCMDLAAFKAWASRGNKA